MKPRFLELTEETNALDYLEKAVDALKQTCHSDWAWKWVTIGLHGALYGFAICASRGTDSDSVRKFDNKTKQRKNELIGFDAAIKRCEAGAAGTPLILTVDERKAIEVLKKTLRNNFEHYQPRHWSIELHGFPDLVIECVQVIERLATETSMWVRLTPTQRERVKKLADEAQQFARDSVLYQEYHANH